MMADRRLEFAFARQSLPLAGVRHFLRVMGQQQVIANLRAQAAPDFLLLLGPEFFQAFLAFGPLGQIFRILLRQSGSAEQRLVVGFTATGENPVERIIILRWNRIEFMIVTTGTA